MHQVKALLDARRATGSRADGHRIALAIEGGGSRGAFSGGMVVALQELGHSASFDAVYGSSAGALNGAWFLAGQADPSIMAWADPEVIRRTTNPWRALRLGRVVDTEHLVQTVYESIPMDFAAILANPTTFHPLATSTTTGAAVDLHPHLTDQRSVQLALRASTGLPLLSGPPVPLGDDTFIDAGLAEAIPFRAPLAAAATHVLVLRTRQTGWTSGPPSKVEGKIVSAYLNRAAPGALSSWAGRERRAAADDHDLATDPRVLEVRPAADAPEVGRLARDTGLLAQAVESGRQAVLSALA
ncbi:patatin-like phospholipase family protein [Actinokineospora sp. G85]|uniref:patatin-like phospholipase family protein n=1 Tax=Actinokineospora sp. G85 TaxID=3406626 RepID=UPI003C78C9E2